MIRIVAADLLILRKRAATWTLLAIWTALAAFFAYGLPYLTYRNSAGTGAPVPPDLLPGALVGNVVGGFPFFGGAIALLLGVLVFGSDYGWGTLKTLFTQGPGRLRVFGARIIALGIVLTAFVVTVFAAGSVSSLVIAQIEGASIVWPSVWLVGRPVLAGWFLLAVWAGLGVMLAVLSRGTSLAIGVGILYALVIEGLISAFLGQISVLEPLVKFFLRANAYSLIDPLGLSRDGAADNGPGSFTGPFVSSSQSFLVLTAYLVVFLGAAAILLRRRDVV